MGQLAFDRVLLLLYEFYHTISDGVILEGWELNINKGPKDRRACHFFNAVDWIDGSLVGGFNPFEKY